MHLDTFFIDLDDTVYPPNTGIWERIGQRMNLFIEQRLAIPHEDVSTLRRSFYETYGTTMRGLEIVYHIDTDEFLDFVHDVHVEDHIVPDPELRRVLLAYPQRKVIFTNADRRHAERVLTALNLLDCFEGIIDILQLYPVCKPDAEAFTTALRLAGVTDPSACLMADDSPRNIEAARAAGLYTVLIGETHPAAHHCLPLLRDLPTVLPLPEAS
jgi:pyrimidine 5'-nucleotidase